MQGAGGPIRSAVALALMAAALSLPAPAAAATIGSIAPPGLTGGCGNCDGIQAATAPFPSSPSYAVPTGRWTITSWRAMGDDTVSGQLQLRIYRPTGVVDQWTLVAQTGLETFAPNVPTAHPASLSVKAGDVLGLTTGPNVIDGTPYFYGGVAGDEMKGLPGITPAIGGVYGPDGLGSNPEERLNVEATLIPSNRFTIGKAKRNKRKGTAKLAVKLPGPGGRGARRQEAEAGHRAGPERRPSEAEREGQGRR